MTRRWITISRTLLVLAVAASLFVTAGVYNVSARVGHWPVTAWFLHFIMRQSARTHSFGIEPPALDDPRMVIRGATYFAVGCAVCHGEPGSEFTPIVHYTTPEAPRLKPLIDTWEPHELFWIVDNGIKYTGMPAWATPDRPDEVWSMVAFLQKLPELDAAEYRELSFEPTPLTREQPSIVDLELDERGTRTLAQCARCHGFDGMGRSTGAFPFLSGQNERYLYESLQAFATNERASGIMQPIAAGLTEAAMRNLARHYAEVEPPARPGSRSPPGDASRGAMIAATGIPERGVPACLHCHGPGRVADNPVFPRLAGQNYSYLVSQLELWRAGTRGGTAYAPLMHTVANALEDEQIRNVAAFYSTLPVMTNGRSGVPSKAENR